MKKTKHTPGPWIHTFKPAVRATNNWTQGTIKVDSDRNTNIAFLPANKYEEMNDEIRANANLIVAAPELLKELVDLCENMEAMSGLTDLGNHDFYNDTAAARKAIAKATRP